MAPDPQHLLALRAALSAYGPLSDATFNALSTAIDQHRLSNGTYLLSAGTVATHRYFVSEGIVVSEIKYNETKRHFKNFFIRGNFAGSIASTLQGAPSRLPWKIQPYWPTPKPPSSNW